ncbi:MAG TPA: hypothetical protein VFF79_01130 [Conexibacter sp.]|jgi:hypothetical protein|nr:hypothetical protein [Conexibacter sp.]
MHRNVAAAFVAALALGIASCGGAAPLTRAELSSKIETVCRQATQQAQQQEARATRSARKQSSGEAAVHFLTSALVGQRTIVARIEGFDASSEAKADFDAFKAGMKQRAAVFTRIKDAGAGGFQSALAASQVEVRAISERLQQAANHLGLRGCV